MRSDTASRTQRLRRLIAPRHIAFIGGRSLTGAIRTCLSLGYDGEVWVVNPSLDEIGGYPCVPSVGDLPDAPDAAFVGVRRELAVSVVRDLAERGAGGCVCLASGFSEIGEQGADWQSQLIDAAGTMAVVGPNCYGVLNYLDGVALWPDLHGGARVEHGAALISQSGNISLNATMADRSLPLSHVFSIGNQAVLDVSDYIEVLLEDPRVRAIGMYIEGITDLPRFRHATTRAAQQGVPLVALKAGATSVSATVVANHTGSDAGVAETYESLFAELGIAQVGTLPELLETLKLLTAWRDSGGPGVALVTASGGDSALVADLAVMSGLTFPPFDDHRAAELHDQLGELVSISNPLDYSTVIWGDRERLERCFTTVMEAAFDAVLLVLDHPREGAAGDQDPWQAAAAAFLAAHERTGTAAAVLSTLPECLPMATRERLSNHGVVPLQGLREAVTAIAAGARYAQRRQESTARNGRGPQNGEG